MFMYMPTFDFKTTYQVVADSFGGLNRSATIGENEFTDMENMSSDNMPYLSPIKSRQIVFRDIRNIRAVIAPHLGPGESIEKFTGIAGTTFYYDGEAVEKEDNDITISEGEKCLVDFYGYILIFPDKLYYCYSEKEKGEHKLKRIEQGYYESYFTFESSGSVDQNNLENTITRRGGWEEFKSGDSLSINVANADNTEISNNNTVTINSMYMSADDDAIASCVVASVDSDKLTVNCYNRLGSKIPFTRGSATGSITRAMPDITKACVCNNRVFGVDAEGEMVYASKLADFKNWNVFEGLSTDSWYAEVGTDGRFTSIVPFKQTVIAFKDNYIHQIYGSAPANFSLSKQLTKGCIDGRSVAEVNGTLFFLSYDGIYAYAGGNPECISHKLNRRYSEGVGGTDGRKYYISVSGDGTTELLVYDTLYNVWHKEDDFNAIGFIRYNDGLYAATSDTIYRFESGDETVKWSVVTKAFTDSVMDRRGTNNLYFRATLQEKAEITIYVSYDGGDWVECGTITGTDRNVKRIPVLLRSCDKYRIKIEGEGNALIESIERKLTSCGRNENY